MEKTAADILKSKFNLIEYQNLTNYELIVIYEAMKEYAALQYDKGEKAGFEAARENKYYEIGEEMPTDVVFVIDDLKFKSFEDYQKAKGK